MNKRVLFAASLTVAAGLAAALASLLLWQPQVFAQGEVIEVTERLIDPSVQKWGYMAAALSTAIGALGAAYAVAVARASARGGWLVLKPASLRKLARRAWPASEAIDSG